VKGIHDPLSGRTPPLDQAFYPFSAISGNYLNTLSLLISQFTQEALEYLFTVALSCPDKTAAVVIDYNSQISVAFLVRRLINTNSLYTIEALCASGTLKIIIVYLLV